MAEYIENGARLGWLLDPFRKEVHVYRPGREPETLKNPAEVSREEVLKAFVLRVPEIWAEMEGEPRE